MTPHNDLLCALCGNPIPDLRTSRVYVNGARVHAICATRHDLDLEPDPPPAVLPPPPCRTLVATLCVYFAWGALAGLLVAGSIGIFGGWLWRIW